MTILLTALIVIFVNMPSDAVCSSPPRFSPLATDMLVAQTTPTDSLPIVRRQVVTEDVSASDEAILSLSGPEAVESPSYAPQTPSGALYRSLALAGWGQWRNGRRMKALFFFTAEAVCIGGYLYENSRYTSGDYIGGQKDAIRTDRNTWLLYWMVAKVFGIMDAYVDAQFKSYDIDDITPSDLAR